MARGGGTGSRNKKKKAGPDTAAAPQNGVTENNIKNNGDHAADKHKNIKHTRKQKEDTPPVVPHQEDDSQLKEGKQKREPTSEELRLAQITQGADSNKDPQRKATINQIMEITGKSEDDVATALFDTDWDENRAIDLLLDESAGFGSWEETGKKKTKKADKEEGRENEDLNDDFDPTNSDNRERSRNRGGPPRLRNGRGGSNHAGGRGDSDWKHREHQENERNFEGGRGRGGRGMGPRGRGGHVGMAPRGERRGGRGGGPRGGGHRPEQDSKGGVELGQIDTWNPIGSEQQEQQRRRNNKDAFDNAGNWGDDFPAAEDWDNDEYTGSLADSKVFTPSGTSAKAVGEPVNGSAAGHVGQPGSGQAPGGGQAPAANNSLSYSQPIDLSSLLKTGGLSQYNAAASQDLKSAIGIGGGKAPGGPPGDSYTGGSLSYSSGSSPYTSQGHQSSSFSSAAPGSAFSPIKPAAVTNGAGGGKSMPRARLPPPSRIPSSAVEMPGAGEGSLSNLDVQFGGMDLQFGGSVSSNDASTLEFNAAPGQGLASSTTPSNKDSSYVHSIQSSGGKDDSYKASSSLAPGSVKDVNQSLSSALSAGIKPPVAGGADSVPGYGRGGDSDSRSSGPGSRSGEKYGSAPQRSPGPALINKPDLGYNSQSSYPYQSSGGQSSGGKSSYNSYSGASQSYERQSSSGYSGTNGLSSNYGGGSGSSSSYNNASQAGSGYPSTNSGFNSSQQGNNFGSSYGAATTAGAYSSFSSQNSYSGKTGGSSSQTSNTGSYLPTTSALSSYSNSGPDASPLTSTVASSKTSAYASTETVSASSSSLGLSSATNSSKMSVNTTQGNKLVPGMPPGVAGVLPAQYMTPAGFPAAYLAGLGQPAAAMYGYGGVGGHQLEDLAALQRSTLAASLPQLVGSSAGGQPGAGSQVPQAKGFGAAGAGAGGVGAPQSSLSGRQDAAGQNTFSDSKFSAAADSTSSPVPSSVGNTVGQQPAFNLASTFTAAAAQHPTLPPGYAYFYGGVGGMPGLQYGGGVAGGGVYPGQHPGIPVPTAAGPTSTSQFQNTAYGKSYGTSYDSLSLGQSNSGYVKNNYANDSSQGKAGGTSNNTAAGTGYWSNLW